MACPWSCACDPPLHPLSKLLAIQDHTQNLEEQLWMGGRREVSIMFYRPVTRSDLKQETSFFRGSVSSFLQLVVAREITSHLLEEHHENLVAAVKKWEILAATKVQMSGSEQEQVRHFLHKTCNQEVSGIFTCSRTKKRQRNVQKSVLHVPSCFLLIRPIVVFYRSRFLRSTVLAA